MKKLNFENNDTFDCYINDDRGYQLAVNECGYEKCSPSHYWEGIKSFYLFHYILKGKGILRINNGESKTVKAGQVFFITPQDHVYYEADEDEPWEYIWIGFSGLSVKGIVKDCAFFNECIQNVKNEKKFIQIYKNMAACSRKGNVAYLLVLSELYKFLAYLLQNYGGKGKIKNFTQKEQNFQKIIKIIDHECKNNISIEEISQKIGYEKTYIYRCFKDFLGISPCRYINYCRIYNAIERIKSNDYKNFESLAVETGFQDYISFFRCFKSFTGLSPNLYSEKTKDNTITRSYLNEFDELEKKIDRFK